MGCSWPITASMWTPTLYPCKWTCRATECLCQPEVRAFVQEGVCSRSKVRHWGVPCPTTEPQGLRDLGSPYQGGQFSVRHLILEGRSLFTESLTIPCSVATKESTRMTVPMDRWLRGLREATILDFLSLKEALSCHRIGGHSWRLVDSQG